MARAARIAVAALAAAALLLPSAPASAAEIYPMVFPVVGEVAFSDTFGDPRGGGRSHAGQDLMADKMTPVVAVADATVGWMHNEQGGKCCAMALRHDDGWESWYIHLNNDTPGTDDGLGWGFAEGIEPGVHVKAGQLIGWVGDSGNAEWTQPHVHFELHRPDDSILNPYESLLAATHMPVGGADYHPVACDFDGDGMDDAVAGEGGDDGSGTWIVYGSGASEVFGTDPVSTVACGDFDDDGLDDLVIGQAGFSQSAGRIVVHEGSEAGLLAGVPFDASSHGVPGAAEPGDELGASLAVGDFNSDGFDDVAVGAPSEAFGSRANVGYLVVMFGSPSGLSGVNSMGISQATSGIAGAAEAGDSFASSIAAGDVDADGFDDLIVGVPGESFGTKTEGGAIHLIYGSAGGLTGVGDRMWTQSSYGIAGGAESGDRFGEAVISADFNRDGFWDVAVGVPNEGIGTRTSSGAVHVILGSATGFKAAGNKMWHQASPGIEGAVESGDIFGASLAVTDLDDDPWPDLVVGVPGEGIGAADNAGAIQILFGSVAGPKASGDLIVTQSWGAVTGSSVANDRFGSSISSGDFDGDGSFELLVGIPGKDLGPISDAGRALVLTLSPTQTISVIDGPSLGGNPAPGDGLGVVDS